MSCYKQGIFKCKNPGKYLGNVKNIIYRSSWEFKFMNFLDNHPDILKWASEEISIKYLNPNDEVPRKPHRYFVDFWIKKKNRDGKIEVLLIELKPEIQTKPPVKTKRKREKTYLKECLEYTKNQAKWKYAKEFANENNMKFVVLTENDCKF